MTFVIVLVVVVVVALGLGFRYDRKHRSLRDSPGGGETARGLRLDGREKGSRWGAGGGG
jgi:hypothetical protein